MNVEDLPEFRAEEYLTSIKEVVAYLEQCSDKDTKAVLLRSIKTAVASLRQIDSKS